MRSRLSKKKINFCLVVVIFSSSTIFSMGSIFTRLIRGPPPNDLSKRPLTEEERTQLIRLGTTAGSPSIINEAILSGNIMDPMHMRRAEEMNAQWEEGIRVIGEALRKQKEKFPDEL